MLDVVAWHNAPLALHIADANKYSHLGYSTLSLSMYGDPAAPFFAAAMIKRAAVLAEEQHPSFQLAAFSDQIQSMQAKKMGLAILTATGPKSNPVFAACYRPMSDFPEVRIGLDAGAFAKANSDFAAQGKILVWVDTYGDAGEVMYLGLWQINKDNRAWNIDGLNENDAAGQARFDAMVGGYARPTLLARAGGVRGGTFVMYDDSFLNSAWASYTDMTADQYQKKYNDMQAKGLQPMIVSGKGFGPGARFAAIFAAQEYTAQRGHRSSDLTPLGVTAVQEVDDAMLAVINATMLHGASLAVVKGSRLVYARGYTFAEPGYPDVQPTSLFRQASVSKTFTAAAIYELIDEKVKLSSGQLFSTDTLVLDVLPEIASTPATGHWKDIKIQHLLEMTSGVTTSLLGTDPQASSTLPVDALTMAKWIYKQPLGNTPGDIQQGNYSNAGFMLLGMVVAKLRNKATFVEALQDTLMKRLHITRLRAARSVPKDQAPDEARYHARPLTTGSSVMATGQPICTTGYGEWNLEMTGGGGGLSVAATDVARLLAALSLGDTNPLMSNATLNTWMANAANATATVKGPRAWGFHGFDGVSATDAAKHLYWGYKGGDLSSSQNGIYFEMGGYSTVLCFNGLTPQPSPGWYPAYQALLDAVRKHDWGDVDLFPKFGMPSFPTTIKAPILSLPKQNLSSGAPAHIFTPIGAKKTQM